MSLLTNLLEHWRKYAVVALATLCALLYGYVRIKRVVHHVEFYNESLLRLSGGNVQLYRPSGAEQTSATRLDNPVLESVSKQPYVPPEGQVVITPKDKTKKLSDVVNVQYDRYGLCKEFGVTVGPLPQYFGVDMKWGYINRWGSEVGFVYMINYKVVSPTLGISYRLDQIGLPNTELTGGLIILPRNTGFVGVRINL